MTSFTVRVCHFLFLILSTTFKAITENISGVLKYFCIFVDLCGTPGYLAPEVLKCNMFENAEGYGQEVDV